MSFAQPHMTPRLVDSLYVEAMVLADEARGYFDDLGRGDRDRLTPMERVAFSCESLKVTTRLMHVIAWLLTRKAIAQGELIDDKGANESRRLGRATESDAATCANLPLAARQLIETSSDLYARVARIDREMRGGERLGSPARGLMRKLERAF